MRLAYVFFLLLIAKIFATETENMNENELQAATENKNENQLQSATEAKHWDCHDYGRCCRRKRWRRKRCCYRRRRCCC